MKPVLLAALTAIGIAAPAKAEIYTHTGYGPGGIECETTLLTLSRSSYTDCTTPADRKRRDAYKRKQDAELDRQYRAAAARLGVKPACETYAKTKISADKERLYGRYALERTPSLTRVSEAEMTSAVFTCKYSFAKEGKVPESYAAYSSGEVYRAPADELLYKEWLRMREREQGVQQ